MKRDIRASFEIASNYYKYRVPYHPDFFKYISKHLALTKESIVLDVCCGTGQLSYGLSNYVGHVVGIDFSERMLEEAPKHKRVEYFLHDVNGDAPAPPALKNVPFDHLFFGRSIHWVEPKKLDELVKNNLRQGGAIVICLAAFPRDSPQNAWMKSFNELRNAYSYDEAAPDHTGMDRLPALGFQPVKRLAVPFGMRMNVESLTLHALSYGRSAAIIDQDRANFSRKLAEALSPYMTDGSLIAYAHSVALIYRRIGTPSPI